jgi:predicted outer membrane repeat protein
MPPDGAGSAPACKCARGPPRVGTGFIFTSRSFGKGQEVETSAKVRIVAATCALLAGMTAAASGRIIYVDDDATGAGSGSSWASACRDLQDALPMAAIGDEIRIAQGVYMPRSRSHGASSFTLAGGLTLKGGYAGFGEADPNARNIGSYETVLSGDANGDDFEVYDPRALVTAPTRGDNCTVVVSQVPPRNVLDGLTIRGGRGGVLLYGVSMILSHCTFIANAEHQGGALAVSAGDVYLEDCRFLGNAADYLGGALFLERSGATIIDCEFAANYAPSGGAIAGTGSLVSLSGCTFRGNSAQSGGGLYQQTGSFLVADCLFENNVVRYRGGAMQGSGAMQGNVTTLNGCRFVANSADDVGGALADLAWPSRISNCIFAGNRAGAGGAFFLSAYSGPLLLNCTLTGNRAQTGQALSWSRPYPPRMPSGSNTVTPFKMSLRNCILWDGPSEIGSRETEPAEITITYTDVLGGWPGVGNMDADPLFARPGYWDPNDDSWVSGDYHLKSQGGRLLAGARSMWVLDEVTSPCIDAGDPNSPVGDEPVAGRHSGRVNMGAYGGTAEASKSYLNEP